MDQRIKTILYVLGIIGAIIVVVFYLIPFLIGVLGAALAFLVVLLKYAIIILGVIVIVRFILQLMKK